MLGCATSGAMSCAMGVCDGRLELGIQASAHRIEVPMGEATWRAIGRAHT